MYIIKLSLNDDTLFLLKIRKSIPEWTYEKEKTRLFRLKLSAFKKIAGKIFGVSQLTKRGNSRQAFSLTATSMYFCNSS